MAYWSECPICGNKNYYEDDGIQYFDCSFAGEADDDVRVQPCGATASAGAPGDAAEGNTDAGAPGDVRLYRLAFLDAARVADDIAASMAADAASQEQAQRCRTLAEQMRAFAGHDPAASQDFDDLSAGQGRGGANVTDWVRRFNTR